MPAPLDVAAALAAAARDVRAPEDLAATLRSIVHSARESMPHVDDVGITRVHQDGRLETLAATGEVVERLDEVQRRAGEGPVLDEGDAGGRVRVERAARDRRWPRFLPEAVGLGLRSLLVVALPVEPGTRAVLSTWSWSDDRIPEETEQLAELFAEHAGLVLGHARRLEHLNTALASRTLIGMALGILMQRFALDEETAFAYLTRVSSTSETKLRDVAASLVEQHHARVGDGRSAALPGAADLGSGPGRSASDGTGETVLPSGG